MVQYHPYARKWENFDLKLSQKRTNFAGIPKDIVTVTAFPKKICIKEQLGINKAFSEA